MTKRDAPQGSATDFPPGDPVASPDSSIRDVLRLIDRYGRGIAVVVGRDRKVVGTVSDGDVRRAILRGVDLDESVRDVMNIHPVVVRKGTSPEVLGRIVSEQKIRQIPVVDRRGRFETLWFMDQQSIHSPVYDTPVVIFAGGVGRRLRPVTLQVPKALLPVKGRPILGRLLEHVASLGFRNVHLCVGYKAPMIRGKFGDGKSLGLDLRYVKERNPRGTAGALSMIREIDQPEVIAMNGDLVTEVDLRRMLEFHQDHRNAATIGVKTYALEIPYGVVELYHDRVLGLQEKPQHRVFVNAGLYVLSSQILRDVPRRGRYDMTDLIHQQIGRGRRIGSFPIHEEWSDVGRLEDLQRVNSRS